MEIEAIDRDFSICKVADYRAVNLEDEFCFVGKTDGERSLVCLTERVPAGTLARDDGWRAFRVRGTLDFSLVGVLAGISTTLAEHGISLFALSTYDTDYVLVRSECFDRACELLNRRG